ncbi:MAG: metal ABC transporter permease [Chloroflexi bacterium]|nr:metal ABC transporter permease [Chloroflexota bacterium]
MICPRPWSRKGIPISTGGSPSLDLSIFGYQFMQNAILSAFLGGVACATIGVFVVLMRMPFIGVAMSHSAFAGALLGLWLGFNPLIGAFVFSLVAAAVIGPLADRGQLSPDTSLGVIFSFMLGLAFLFIGLMPGTKSGALELLWGSILTNTRSDILLLAVVAVIVVVLVFAFYKEIQATIFHRDIALSVGLPATLILYGVLFLTGATVTASLRSIGGLLIFSLILNPAAAAYQLTYSMKKMFLLASGFGVLSGWAGLLVSYLLNIPSGATIVITSSVIFLLAVVFSPKRKLKGGQENLVRESACKKPPLEVSLRDHTPQGGGEAISRISSGISLRLPRRPSYEGLLAMTNQGEVSRAFFNEKAACWDETVSEKDPTKLERMARRLGIKHGSAVLDVGTGTGVLLPYLLNAIGRGGRIVALDFAEEMLRQARAKGPGGNVQYLHADVTDIPLGHNTFDAVVCYSSFPHFHDKPKALAEMKRVMKSGGRLLVCHTSSRTAINEIHRRTPAVQNDLIPDEDEMRLLLSGAGFIDVVIEDAVDSYLAIGVKHD